MTTIADRSTSGWIRPEDAHLSELRVKEGQEVAAGDVVGLSGATGRVTGPHLHWGAKIGNRPFDPQALLDPALFE